MNRLYAATWKRAPRRVVSLDSLLVSDQLNDTAPEQHDGIELVDDLTTPRASSNQYSHEDRGTTQPHTLDDEPRGAKGTRNTLWPFTRTENNENAKYGRAKEWASEITALLMSFLCLIAIFIILLKFNNQQQPDWPYARNSNLSTLVALIATILRSMLEIVLASGKHPLLFEKYVPRSS